MYSPDGRLNPHISWLRGKSFARAKERESEREPPESSMKLTLLCIHLIARIAICERAARSCAHPPTTLLPGHSPPKTSSTLAARIFRVSSFYCENCESHWAPLTRVWWPVFHLAAASIVLVGGQMPNWAVFMGPMPIQRLSMGLRVINWMCRENTVRVLSSRW